MKDSLFNQSLEKGLAVLAHFGTERRAMSLNEIAKAVNITRSSAQRMVHTLAELGYITKDIKTRKFKLTVKTLRIGYNYLAANSVVDIANPFLSELSQLTGETVNLTEPDNTEMVYVARFAAQRYIPIHMPIGGRVPMYCSSCGRAWLSALSREEAKDYIKRSDLRAITPKTITSMTKILEQLKRAGTRGYAVNDEEIYLGDIGIAAPVIYQGRPVAAVHVALPASRWSLAQAEEKLASSVIECARYISASIRAL